MGICRVAADINNHGQTPLDSCIRNLFRIYEKGYLGCKIYAIDKNVNVEDFLEWTTFGSLIQIPLKDIISTMRSEQTHSRTKNNWLFKSNFPE